MDRLTNDGSRMGNVVPNLTPEALSVRFRELFGSDASFVVQAPGRVNLIGEHTDYNDGFVLPAAIDRHILIAGAPRPDRQVLLYALDFEQGDSFTLDQIVHSEAAPWSNYVRGVAHVLQGAGAKLSGINAAITGSLPIGS